MGSRSHRGSCSPEGRKLTARNREGIRHAKRAAYRDGGTTRDEVQAHRGSKALAGVLSDAARAADHADGPRASADPSADITDVFAWMSPDAGRLVLVMDLVRNATPTSRFS